MLIERLKVLGQVILTALGQLNSKSQEKDQQIAALKSQLEAMQTADQAEADAVEELIASIPVEENPTPAFDAIIEQANELPAENTPAVQEALDSTVGTEMPTSEEAVAEAIEMIVDSAESEPTEAEAEPAEEII